MSGPKTADYAIDDTVFVFAKNLVDGAREVAAGLSAEERRVEEQRRMRREERRRMRAATQAGHAARQRANEERNARLRRLLAAWESLGQSDADAGIAVPAAPDPADVTASTAWGRTLDAAIVRMENRLAELAATRGGEVVDALESMLGAGVSVREQLAAYLAQARLGGARPDVAEQRRQLVARVLERLTPDADEPLPAALDALALEIVRAPTVERAEALATELRYQVQRHNEARGAAAEEAKRREAAAVVLEASLRDLGYEVEEIAETLFVEGGIAHFQRPEWGDYFVRLRVDPRRAAMNFNVVRAGAAGEDRKREDMLAEERWCAAHEQLLATLKARGLAVDIVRMLGAGEVPVQVVDATTLPTRAEEERRHASPQARSIE